MYYGGFTYTEAYRLPVYQRYWFIDRLNKEIKKASDGDAPQGSRASHDNDPQMRAMLGRRPDAPPRMRRFS